VARTVKAVVHVPENRDAGPDYEFQTASPTAEKSAGKSATGRPFTGKEDPRNGHGPLPCAPNAGRPPSAVREAMRLAAAQRVSVPEAIADDSKVAPCDRIRAVDTPAKYGLGQMVQVGMGDVRARLRATLELLRETLPEDEFTTLVHNLKEIWT